MVKRVSDHVSLDCTCDAASFVLLSKHDCVFASINAVLKYLLDGKQLV